jgi:hypothetical protein
VGREDVVHEVEELAPPAPRVVARLDQPARDFQGRKERRRPVALVLVGEAGERPTIGQAEPARSSQGEQRRLDLL